MSTSRCFLLASSLARLIQKERGGERVIEGYFPGQADRSSYVQLEGETGSLVVIKKGSAGFEEERAEVPQAHAQALLDVAAGEVGYLRTKLSLGIHEIQVKRYVSPGRLDLVTVAFARAEEAREFYPLPWFGPEVTQPSYQNQSIALTGLPEFLDVPLSDAALGSLLDTLENRPVAARPRPRSTPTDKPASRQAKRSLPAEAPSPAGGGYEAEISELKESLMRELARSLRP